MYKKSILFIIATLLSALSVLGQPNSACPGFHNPVNFNPTPGGSGSWSARVGDRVQGTGGSTGNNVLSTCSRPDKPIIKGHANITSSAYYSGTCTYTDGTCHHTFYDAHDHRFQINNSSTPGDEGIDIFTINSSGQGMARVPYGHTSSIRLGDMRSTGTCVSNIAVDGNNRGSEALFYTMKVTSQNALLFIDYAVVARRFDHTPQQAGEFLIRVCGKNNATGQWNNFPIHDSLWYNVPAPAFSSALPAPWVEGRPGAAAGGTTCGYCYKPWARVAISLIDYIYDSVRVEMYTSDCIYNVDPIYAYIAGSCQPMQITTSGCPAGESTAVDTLRAPEGMLTYTWYVSTNGYSGSTSDQQYLNDNVHFRQVQSSSTSNIYVARTSDFVITESGPNYGDTVGVQTFKCVMTSAMDPQKPFHSRIYATVSNTKPIIDADIVTECNDTSTVHLSARYRIPYEGVNAPHIVDSLTTWIIYEGSTSDTPPQATLRGNNAVWHTNQPGNYACRLTMYTDDSTCNTSRVFLIHIDTPPETRISIDKRTLCVGESATITDLTPDVVKREWHFQDTVISSEISGLDATTSITRAFEDFENPFFIVTSNLAQCPDTLYDTIYFFHDPEINYSEDTIICNGHESHVSAITNISGCTYEWYRHLNMPNESPVSIGNVLRVRPTQPHTTYYLKLTAEAGCVVWDSVTLSLLSTKIIANPSHAKHCPGDTVTLTGEGALYYEWTAYPPDHSLDTQGHNQTIKVSPNQDTRYYLVGYAADSCDIAAIDITVKNVPLPVIRYEFTPNYIDSEVPVVNFTDLSLHRDHTQWLFGDGAASTGQTVSHYFDIYADNSNNVTMISFNELGCSVDTSWTIKIDTFGFFMPNVFTPNKHENSLFNIICPSDLERFHIAIFNRGGALVFSSDDQKFTWDGTHNGKPCPQGSYPYVITYVRSGSVSEHRVAGTITLLR